MEMNKETEERIFAAANSLYEEGGRQSFPKVDVVRRVAQANMNDVSTAMKKWRTLQMTQAAPAVAVQVPQIIEEGGRAMLGALWQSAQELSNNALRSAQAGWEAERLEAAALSREMAEGYEARALEVEAAQGEITRLQAGAVTSASEQAKLQSELDAKGSALADVSAVVADLQARLAQADTDAVALKNQLTDAQALIQKQGLDLARALAHLEVQEKQARQVDTEHANELQRLNKILLDERNEHKEAIDLQRGELVDQAKSATTTRDALNKEIATLKAEAAAAKHAQGQHEDAARKRVEEAEKKLGEAGQAASAAREDAARLGGQVEILKAQVAELMGVMAGRQAVLEGGQGNIPAAGHPDAPHVAPGGVDPVVQA